MRKGGFNGGTHPYGYRVKGEGGDAELPPIAHEQKTIRLIHEKRGCGLSLRAIATEVETETGEKLSHVTVQRSVEQAA